MGFKDLPGKHSLLQKIKAVVEMQGDIELVFPVYWKVYPKQQQSGCIYRCFAGVENFYQ